MDIQAFWSRQGIFNSLLLPLSAVFRAGVALRRRLYDWGVLFSAHPGVPVLVVGNLNAGGSGKTPFVIWLVEWLISQGYCPGVISRGYGRIDKGVRCVARDSRPEEVGDEPLLIHLKTGAPVAVAPQRLDAARLLLARHPSVDVIVADDGLQHYPLRRDLELVLANARQPFGNGWMMPAGPLREPLSRLNRADALILSGEEGKAEMAGVTIPVFSVRHEPAGFRNVADDTHLEALPLTEGKMVEAVAGIAHPQRFFNLLAKMQIPHHPRPFPDHYCFSPSEIDPHAWVVMTEKDAVKCRPFSGRNWWALELRVIPSAGLTDWLATHLARRRMQIQPGT